MRQGHGVEPELASVVIALRMDMHRLAAIGRKEVKPVRAGNVGDSGHGSGAATHPIERLSATGMKRLRLVAEHCKSRNPPRRLVTRYM